MKKNSPADEWQIYLRKKMVIIRAADIGDSLRRKTIYHRDNKIILIVWLTREKNLVKNVHGLVGQTLSILCKNITFMIICAVLIHIWQ